MNINNYQFDHIEFIGLIGAALVLFGFYRTSIGKWKTNSFWYELDNLAGSLFLITYHILTKTYVVLVLNVLWAIVAFKGITSYQQRKSSSKRRRR